MGINKNVLSHKRRFEIEVDRLENAKKPSLPEAVNVTFTFITFYKVIFFLFAVQFIAVSALLLFRCFQNHKAIHALIHVDMLVSLLFFVWLCLGTYWRYRNAGRVCTGLFDHEYDISTKGDREARDAPKMYKTGKAMHFCLVL